MQIFQNKWNKYKSEKIEKKRKNNLKKLFAIFFENTLNRNEKKIKISSWKFQQPHSAPKIREGRYFSRVFLCQFGSWMKSRERRKKCLLEAKVESVTDGELIGRKNKNTKVSCNSGNLNVFYSWHTEVTFSSAFDLYECAPLRVDSRLMSYRPSCSNMYDGGSSCWCELRERETERNKISEKWDRERTVFDISSSLGTLGVSQLRVSPSTSTECLLSTFFLFFSFHFKSYNEKALELRTFVKGHCKLEPFCSDISSAGSIQGLRNNIFIPLYWRPPSLPQIHNQRM